MAKNEALRATFAQNLRTLLEAREKSQLDLAKYMGVAGPTVNDWCRGRKMPRMDKIDKICEFLGTDRATLMGDREVVTPSDINVTIPGINKNDLPPLTPKDEREIARDLERLLNALDDKTGFAAMGGTVEDEEDRELLKTSLLTSMRLARQIAKKKFTPNKYKDEE